MELLLFAVAFLSLHVVDGSYNVSVDDSDGQISYSGSDWEGSSLHPSNLDFGGGHSVSTNPGDTATLTFTGTIADFLVVSDLATHHVQVLMSIIYLHFGLTMSAWTLLSILEPLISSTSWTHHTLVMRALRETQRQSHTKSCGKRRD
jgi:hypothetical protein